MPAVPNCSRPSLTPGPEAAPALPDIIELFSVDFNWDESAGRQGIPDDIAAALKAIGSPAIDALQDARQQAQADAAVRIDEVTARLRNAETDCDSADSSVADGTEPGEVPAGARRAGRPSGASDGSPPPESPQASGSDMESGSSGQPDRRAGLVRVLSDRRGPVLSITDGGNGEHTLVKTADGLMLVRLTDGFDVDRVDLSPELWPPDAWTPNFQYSGELTGSQIVLSVISTGKELARLASVPLVEKPVPGERLYAGPTCLAIDQTGRKVLVGRIDGQFDQFVASRRRRETEAGSLVVKAFRGPEESQEPESGHRRRVFSR